MELPGDQRLAQLEHLGDATPFARRLHVMLPYWPLFENLNLVEVELLSRFMQVYRAEAGQEVIREGDQGDFMMFVIEGNMQVFKRGRHDTSLLIAVVGTGKTLGEMSLIDGDPRSATCIADSPTILGVLTRESLAGIILEQPILGAKILMELVVMLSHRLRETNQQLLACLDREIGPNGGAEAASGYI